jgi:hypothetical protein
MNKLILISVISIFANLFGIATARAAVVTDEVVLAEVQGASLDVQSISLLSDNQIKVTNAKGKQSLIKLNDAANDLLVKQANELADANIINEHHQIICMMMPFGPQTDLYVQGRLVLSPRGCYLANVSYPEKSSDEKLAERLQADLISYTQPKPL